jgi:ABC-type branched-subunit amino acid transport system substrate-binding protein
MSLKATTAAVVLLLLFLPAASQGGLFSIFGKGGKADKPAEEEVVTEEPVPADDEFVPPEGAVRTEDFRDVYRGEGEEGELGGVDEGEEGAPLLTEEPVYVDEGDAEADLLEEYDPDKDPDLFEADLFEGEAVMEEEDPGPSIEEILLGASTDAALLKLARVYAGKGDFRKAALAYQRIIEDFPRSKVRFDAFYELGYLRYRDGRLKESRMFLKYILASWTVEYALKDKARELLKEIDAIYYRGKYLGSKISIGALLPLEGAYAKFGEAALAGLLLAAETFSGGSVPVEVYVRNVGPEPEEARAAIDELVTKKKVRAIIGPLFSSSASVAATYAQNKHVPLIALSQKDKLTEAGDFIFRNALMPDEQATLVAGYAFNGLGARNFAILYPKSYYGTALASSFAEEVKRRGGEIVSVATYTPGARDFSVELREIFGIEEEERTEGRRTIKEYTPSIEVDALYIPEYYQTVSLIVPYLEYFNIDGVQLLGSNGWNSGKLVEFAGKVVEGAVFADGFFVESARPGTVEFRARFKKTFRRDPGVIESQSYDAATALISALAQGDFKWTSWGAVRDRLEGVTGLAGSAGPLSFDENREAVKELYLLTVAGGRIVELTGEVEPEPELDPDAP